MRLSRLLATPSLDRLLIPTSPVRDRRVRSVLLAESVEELIRCPEESMTGERFEQALRWAAEVGLTAVV